MRRLNICCLLLLIIVSLGLAVDNLYLDGKVMEKQGSVVLVKIFHKCRGTFKFKALNTKKSPQNLTPGMFIHFSINQAQCPTGNQKELPVILWWMKIKNPQKWEEERYEKLEY